MNDIIYIIKDVYKRFFKGLTLRAIYEMILIRTGNGDDIIYKAIAETMLNDK